MKYIILFLYILYADFVLIQLILFKILTSLPSYNNTNPPPFLYLEKGNDEVFP